jgi:wyosine [tRNA(Phe)-imidazoG37] synthetase (radical SAM superfamily)
VLRLAGSSPHATPPFVFVEAVAIATIRCLGIAGRYREAQDLVVSLLRISRASINLRGAEAALGFLISGRPVPPYLEKFIGEDRGALVDRFCAHPFGNAEIHQNGSIALCCSPLLPTVIGNCREKPMTEVMNSDTAQAIRKSVVDGSFKYCNHADCPLMARDLLPRKSDYVGRDYDDTQIRVDAATLEAAFSGKSYLAPGLSYITFCLDRTCNLSCPSCRRAVEMVKGAERDILYQTTEREIVPLLKTVRKVTINPAGEVFVSRPSRRLLELLAEPDYAHVHVNIFTNASVCDRAEWDKFKHLYGRIHLVRVSLDAAQKDTFELLRRGANYETTMSNVHDIKAMYNSELIKEFCISFTYQRDNFREMKEFLDLGLSLNVSAVYFDKLQNVGAFTEAEYRELAVHLPDHPLHEEFCTMAAMVKGHPKVALDL